MGSDFLSPDIENVKPPPFWYHFKLKWKPRAWFSAHQYEIYHPIIYTSI